MNLRHAAALALVGWYLIVPPRVGREVSLDAPMSRWEIESSYDSARECQKQLDILQAAPIFPGQNLDRSARSADPNVDTLYAMDRQIWHSVCVASDDPRLKGN